MANQDYARDLSEIRTMMERSSRFRSLSGWAGLLAGAYALLGLYLAVARFGFQPQSWYYPLPPSDNPWADLSGVLGLALAVLLLAAATAAYFSYRSARQQGERAWNATTRRLLAHLAVPLVAGGLLILLAIGQGLGGLAAPLSLLFYGLALYSAGRLTDDAVWFMGLVQIALGLLGAGFPEYALLLWGMGFGAVHLIYGVYMLYRYAR